MFINISIYCTFGTIKQQQQGRRKVAWETSCGVDLRVFSFLLRLSCSLFNLQDYSFHWIWYCRSYFFNNFFLYSHSCFLRLHPITCCINTVPQETGKLVVSSVLRLELPLFRSMYFYSLRFYLNLFNSLLYGVISYLHFLSHPYLYKVHTPWFRNHCLLLLWILWSCSLTVFCSQVMASCFFMLPVTFAGL